MQGLDVQAEVGNEEGVEKAVQVMGDIAVGRNFPCPIKEAKFQIAAGVNRQEVEECTENSLINPGSNTVCDVQHRTRLARPELCKARITGGIRLCKLQI